MMHNTEKFNLIPNEQAGSCKNQRAIFSALEKVLTNDLTRSRRIPSMVISNDAKSSYDCIVLWVALLAMRQTGLSLTAAIWMTQSLQQSRHYITTAYGRLAGYFGHTNPYARMWSREWSRTDHVGSNQCSHDYHNQKTRLGCGSAIMLFSPSSGSHQICIR